VDIAADLDFIVGAFAGDKPTGLCRRPMAAHLIVKLQTIRMEQPPRIIDSAFVKAFAVLDSTVTFKSRTYVYFDGKQVGQVPALAICQYVGEAEFLMFYCNEDWKVLGISAFETLEAAMNRAEIEYEGVSKKWQHPNITEKDLLPEDLEPKCSFCDKPYFKTDGLFEGRDAFICHQCVHNLHEEILKEEQ